MPAGPSPFNPDFSDWYVKKRHNANKKEMKRRTGGGLLNNAKHYLTRDLKSNLTGDVYQMPKQDHDELVKHFNEHQSELSQGYKDGKKLYRAIQTPADYIDYAFETTAQKKQLVTAECKDGHIKKLTYNPLYMLLMVEFSNRGDICVFFNLPANVASTLLLFAENNTMAPPDKNGRERHAVGVEFWNLVRVRGTVHDTQYPFQYTADFRTGMPFGRVPGSGKYEYLANQPDMRFKANREGGDSSARYNKTPVRVLKGEYSERLEEATKFKLEQETDRYAGDSITDDYTEDDLVDFFEDSGRYENMLGKLNGSDRQQLMKLYDDYMNMRYVNTTEGINNFATQITKLTGGLL